MHFERSDPKVAIVQIMGEGVELSQREENAQNNSDNVIHRMVFGLYSWHKSIMRGDFSTSVVLASVADVGSHIGHPQ